MIGTARPPAMSDRRGPYVHARRGHQWFYVGSRTAGLAENCDQCGRVFAYGELLVHVYDPPALNGTRRLARLCCNCLPFHLEGDHVADCRLCAQILTQPRACPECRRTGVVEQLSLRGRRNGH